MDNHFELDGNYRDTRAMTGIDEAGRGCLAGPVVIASVTWRPEQWVDQAWFRHLGDSKTLSPQRRADLYPRILRHAQRVRTAVISNILIDELNILKATLHGFELVAPGFDAEVPLFIDGNQKPPTLGWAKTVVKGDGKLSAVAAAGIVAKVMRDGLMRRLAVIEPNYGFEIHKGYATALHLQSLAKWGASAYHRKSFRPISETPWPDESAEGHLQAVFAPSNGPYAAWLRFCRNYHRFSPIVCRQILTRFREMGCKILPTANDAVGV